MVSMSRCDGVKLSLCPSLTDFHDNINGKIQRAEQMIRERRA